jgi:hypothetical protein
LPATDGEHHEPKRGDAGEERDGTLGRARRQDELEQPDGVTHAVLQRLQRVVTPAREKARPYDRQRHHGAAEDEI